jgi:hypothetical protein
MTTSQIVKRIRRFPLAPWNTGGYRLVKSHRLFLDEYMLGDVAALDAEKGALLAFPGNYPHGLKIIDGFPFESEEADSATVQIKLQQLGEGTRIAHAASGLPGEPHFALDIDHGRIIEIPALTDFSSAGVRPIDLDLPDGVRLSADSRLAVLPRDPRKPEVMTPALFLSAPESNVVLKVDRVSGSATVIAGQIGRSGTPGQRDQNVRSVSRRETLGRAAHAQLGSPRGLFFDEPTQRLLIVDSPNGAIYAVSMTTGAIDLVATSDPALRNSNDVAYFAELSGVKGTLLYRLSSLNVDGNRLVRNLIDVTPGWGDAPVTIIFWAENSMVVTGWLNTTAKNRNHFSTKFVGIRSALVHPSGELLLLAPDRVGHMKHPAVLTDMHFAKDARSPVV